MNKISQLHMGSVMRLTFFLNFFRMSKNNLLRAKINREAENNKNVSSIFSKTWRMWFYVYYAPKHYRSFRTWKHNRKQQFKNK